MTVPTIIRAEAAEEFLALVPSIAGFAPRRSLVCVVFRGSRTVGVLRHDLPHRIVDHRALVSAVLGTLCRISEVDGVVPIVYTDRAYPRGRGAAERRLLGTVADRLASAGYAVRDSLLVAATGWASQLDPGAPPTGHPPELIELASARLGDAVPADASAGVEPLVGDAGRAGEIDRLLDEIERSATLPRPFAEALGAALDPVELVESLIADSAEPDAARLAWLAHLGSLAAFRDAIAVQIGFGAAAGELAIDGAAAANDRAAEAGLSVDELVAADLAAGSVDEIDEVIVGLFLGRTGLRPEPRRVRRGIRVLELAIAEAPRRYLPGLLCIVGWLHWSQGRGSRAGEQFDRALDLDPRHPMARLLSAFLATGALPDWLFEPARMPLPRGHRPGESFA